MQIINEAPNITENYKTEVIRKVTPIELKMSDNQVLKLRHAFTHQHTQLVRFIANYYNLKYAELVARKFKFDKHEYDTIFKEFCENANVTIGLATVRCQIDKILETLKGNYELNRSKPNFSNLYNLMRVRITNNNSGKAFYKRELTLFTNKDDTVLSFKFSLTSQTKINGYIAMQDNFTDKYRYQEIINALKGVGGYGVGDPSELVMYNGNRFILNLVIKKTVYTKSAIENKKFNNDIDDITLKDKTKIMGVDLGLAKNIAVAVVVDTLTNKVIGVEKIKSEDIMRKFFKEKDRQAIVSKRMHQGTLPYRKGEKGATFKKVTKLGKSWLETIYKQLTYHCVNEIITLAKRYNVSTIRIEDLKNFKYKIKDYARKRKFHGKMLRFNRNNQKSLQEFNKYKKLTKIASMFKYGLFKQDLENEAHKNFITLSVISPFQTSQKCYKCGHIAKENRENRDVFKCVECGHRDDADFVGAVNIAVQKYSQNKKLIANRQKRVKKLTT
jgi:transposase